MRTGQRKWDKSTAQRRPVHYWATLNNWWRGYLEEKGRRPSSTEVQVWYNEHADAVWGSSKPTWKEARVHAKCLRSTEQVKNYFRRYRRARGSASAGRGAAGARQAPEEAPDGEDAGEDNDVASLIAFHNASLVGGGRTIHTDSPGSSAADALLLPSLSQRSESHAIVHVKEEEQDVHQLGREAPVFGMLNPATVTTGDSPTPPWLTRMPSGRPSRFRPNQSPADGRRSPGRTPLQEIPSRPAQSLLRHSTSVGPLTSSTCDAAAAAWNPMGSPATTSTAWHVAGSSTQPHSTMGAGYSSPDLLPASTLTATHSLPAALTSSLSTGMGLHSYAYQGEAVAMAVDTPRPLTPLYRGYTAHETQTGHNVDMYTRRHSVAYWDSEAELHNRKPRMVSAASAALPEGSTSTSVANSMEWQAGAPPQGSRPELSRSAAAAAAAAAGPTTGSTTPRSGPLPTIDSVTDLAELLAGFPEDPDASADPHTSPRQLRQAHVQPGLHDWQPAKASSLLDVPRSASFPYGSHPRSRGMTTMTPGQHGTELHMAPRMSVEAWSHQQPHLAKTQSVPNSPRPVLPYDLQSDVLPGWRGALGTSGGGATTRAGSSGTAARPSFLELLESQACKHEEEEEQEDGDEQQWQELQHQHHYLDQQQQQQQQQLYQIQYVQPRTAAPVLGYPQPWQESHGTSQQAGDHAFPVRRHVRELPQDVQRLWQEGDPLQQDQQYHAQEQQQRQAQGQQHRQQRQQWQQQQQHLQGDQEQEGRQQQGQQDQEWAQQNEQCHEQQMHLEQQQWVVEQQPCQQPHWGSGSQGVLEEQQQQQGDAQCQQQQQQQQEQEQLVEHSRWAQQYQ